MGFYGRRVGSQSWAGRPDQPVFQGVGRPVRVTGPVMLASETLAAWGHLSVPGPLWRTLLRLGAWVEPVLVAEWARLIRGYAVRIGRACEPGAVEAHLGWDEPARDTDWPALSPGGLPRQGRRRSACGPVRPSTSTPSTSTTRCRGRRGRAAICGTWSRPRAG